MKNVILLRTGTIKPSAIIVSHGQPSEPLPAEADLAELTAKVASHLPGWQVLSATLATPDALEATLAKVDGSPLIFPLFMTDGWFVRSALPKRLGAVQATILPPLGVAPALPELVADDLIDALRTRGWVSGDTTLLVASHGSGRSPNSRLATEAFVENLSSRISFAELHVGYVEEEPFLEVAAKACTGQTLCLPFFAAYGGHVKEDIKDALKMAGLEDALLDPIGITHTIPEFIAGILRDAARNLVTNADHLV